ncbi:mitochondrial carrier [Malassezia pachydermatis]|uniref:Mitochondrial carrier n=1 Tax=Malassezia pachydermatis TaxID=77020 RepID=A0A0M9VQS8_9BASI|nr:mitochondrial carrier [Malassezia pachydermatis]KOS15843.1 mitochondrial carrier [Malassezia pachydermatis]
MTSNEQQEEAPSPPSNRSNAPNVVTQKRLWPSLIAGGCAGATSRTLVSPLERLKTYAGVWKGLSKIWQEEGFLGFMRGNTLNCLRIAPYSAVQFSTYEVMKQWLSHPVEYVYTHEDGSKSNIIVRELGTIERLVAGAVAGFTSVVSTYPLDLVRSRISIATASMYTQNIRKGAPLPRVPGVWETTVKVYREEGGIRGLYRGCIPTSVGVAPYVAFNFVFYESARAFFTQKDGTPPGPITKLLIGAWAGAVSQTLTYPLDVIRRRMQVSGMRDSKLGVRDKGGIDAIRNIVRTSGFKGLYYGLFPNLLKVAPSTGAYFLTYELVTGLIDRK